jgi:hypothetical protein
MRKFSSRKVFDRDGGPMGKMENSIKILPNAISDVNKFVFYFYPHSEMHRVTLTPRDDSDGNLFFNEFILW